MLRQREFFLTTFVFSTKKQNNLENISLFFCISPNKTRRYTIEYSEMAALGHMHL
jgi:hypothetical protein